MAKVNFLRRKTNEEVNSIPISDGNFIVSGEGKAYIDYENARLGLGGTPDTEMSDTSTNSVENKVVKKYIDNHVKKITNIKILGTASWYMNANQTLTLTESIQEQTYGIILHWQGFNTTNNQVLNSDHVYTFIPKTHIINSDGTGIQIFLSTATLNTVGAKFVYVSNTSIKGHAANVTTGTGKSGITYNNKYWVLTQVLGV